MSQVAHEFPADVPDQPELVSMRRENGLVWLTIERPEVMNCLSFPTLKRLRMLCETLREDLSIRAILITGAGDKSFCAGADLKERKTMPAERVPLFVKNIRKTMDDVEALPQPTIAVVNGFAFGGGMELLLACDLRVAASHAQFGLTETSLAIIPGAGGTQRLPRLVGRSRAKDLILTARKIDALEAERIGLVSRIALAGGIDKLREAALALARTIADNGPVAVRAAKAAIDHGSELPIAQGIEVEARCYERVLPTQDRLEALAAFAEKRKPVFKGS
jgi:enoyl-CoA hydratase/carnithine racemase